jgi:hypothetical protein
VSNLPAKKTAVIEVPDEVFKPVLEKCLAIMVKGRHELIKRYYELGQAIWEAIPPSHVATYGTAIVKRLALELGTDDRSLWHSIQFAKSPLAEKIVSARSLSFMSWSKVRMLLVLEPEMQDKILRSIEAGTLRTDLEVRDAIMNLKELAGTKRVTAADRFQDDFFGDNPLVSRLRQFFKKADPTAFFFSFANWSGDVDIEHAQDPIGTLGAIREAMRRLEEKESILAERVGDANA